MTRLFGCISNQPQRLAEALEPVRAALVVGRPIARWGIGYVQSGEVLLSHHPRAVEGELDLFPVIARLASDCIVGAADVDDGLRGQAATQPFRFRRWMFAQENSAVGGDPAAVVARLAHRIPDFLRRNLRGPTPAEHVFHMFLARLHEAGTLDVTDLGAAPIRYALRETVADVAAAGAEVGAELPLGNLILSDSRRLIAVRLAGPLFVRRLKQQTDPRLPESQFKSVLAVSCDQLPGEGFEEIPHHSALTIARNISTDIALLDS